MPVTYTGIEVIEESVVDYLVRIGHQFPDGAEFLECPLPRGVVQPVPGANALPQGVLQVLQDEGQACLHAWVTGRIKVESYFHL